MPPNLARRPLLVLLVLVALAGAGCGDDDETPDRAAAAGDATVAVAPTSLGDVLVDGEGRTLYLFTNDQGETSSCTGGCASAWPAVTVEGEPVAGDGVDAAKLATNASGQVMFGGKLLYRYAADQEAGDVKGQGVGGAWFAIDGEGRAVQPDDDDDVAPTPSY